MPAGEVVEAALGGSEPERQEPVLLGQRADHAPELLVLPGADVYPGMGSPSRGPYRPFRRAGVRGGYPRPLGGVGDRDRGEAIGRCPAAYCIAREAAARTCARRREFPPVRYAPPSAAPRARGGRGDAPAQG
jgi:hypothetical protein